MTSRLTYLDGLRGVAVLMVFTVHAAGFGVLRQLGPVGASFVDHGKYGVTVFFVVSAFSLSLSLSEGFLGPGRVSWRAYFIRRFFRIAPLFYAVLFVLLAIGYDFLVPRDGYAETTIYHLTFANVAAPWYANDMIGVEWTIAVECAFYLMLPFIVALCRLRFGLALLLLIAAALFAKAEAIAMAFGEAFYANRNYSIVWHFYAFAAGIAVYFLVKSARAPRWALAGMGAAAWLAAFYMLWTGESGLSGLLIALCAAVTILNAARGGWAHAVLAWPPLAYAGKISYSIYLTHFMIAHYFGKFGWSSPAQLLGMLVLTIAVSSLTYYAIERPFIRLGARLSNKLRAERVAKAA